MALQIFDSKWLGNVLSEVELRFTQALGNLDRRRPRVAALQNLDLFPQILWKTKLSPELWFRNKLYTEVQGLVQETSELLLSEAEIEQRSTLRSVELALATYQHSCGTWTIANTSRSFLENVSMASLPDGHRNVVGRLLGNLEDEIIDFFVCCAEGQSLDENGLADLLEAVTQQSVGPWGFNRLFPVLETYRFMHRYGFLPKDPSERRKVS